MSLPSWFGSTLSCGCVRGIKVCAEGERLWDAVADAHNALAAVWREKVEHGGSYEPRLLAARRPYDEALAAFTAHVEVDAKVGVQAVML